MEKKREILEEQIKQALTSTYRVISDQLKNNKTNNKTSNITNLDFSEIKDLKNKNDYIKLRASTDSKALKLRFSDQIIFHKNHPRNPALKKIYELSEIMRCEILGTKMLNGIKKNLEDNYYQKIGNKKYKETNNKDVESIHDAFELYILEKFFKFKLNQNSQKILNYWRKDFDKNFNKHITYLEKNVENQDNFNSKFSQLLENMDIFENSQDQQNMQDKDSQNPANNENTKKDDNIDENNDSSEKRSEDQLSSETDYDVNQFRMEDVYQYQICLLKCKDLVSVKLNIWTTTAKIKS